jgi:hypothetical protein
MLTALMLNYWTMLEQNRDHSAAAVCLFSLLGLAASLAFPIAAVLD